MIELLWNPQVAAKLGHGHFGSEREQVLRRRTLQQLRIQEIAGHIYAESLEEHFGKSQEDRMDLLPAKNKQFSNSLRLQLVSRKISSQNAIQFIKFSCKFRIFTGSHPSCLSWWKCFILFLSIINQKTTPSEWHIYKIRFVIIGEPEYGSRSENS